MSQQITPRVRFGRVGYHGTPKGTFGTASLRLSLLPSMATVREHCRLWRKLHACLRASRELMRQAVRYLRQAAFARLLERDIQRPFRPRGLDGLPVTAERQAKARGRRWS
jgi:hypothetical protein